MTALIAVKNEQLNIASCIESLGFVERVIVIDSHSVDETCDIARARGAEVVQFDYYGGYPKKRQWALETLSIDTEWVLLLDADEKIPDDLINDIQQVVTRDCAAEAYEVVKGFHFMGRKFRFGGFSHSAVILFKTGKARFEQLFDDDQSGLDMEVHERVIVDGAVAKIRTPLLHDDRKSLECYISRHNQYSTWEASLRYNLLKRGQYGVDVVSPNMLGNAQEVRRALKLIIIRLPFEHYIWFVYHYVLRLGFLEGTRGLIASQIRSCYIQQVRAKLHEMLSLDRQDIN